MNNGSDLSNLNFYIYSDRRGDAFQNMADDLLLLEHVELQDAVRFRHYEWKMPAYTFGYGQSYAEVKSRVEQTSVQLCRRPTGGGVVDHRNDWTYTLILPPRHRLVRERALVAYGYTHRALADALIEQGQPAELISCPSEKEGSVDHGKRETGAVTLCFQQAVLDDVINPQSQIKIAGAALKRNRHGMLIQGSINRAAITVDLDWVVFKYSFVHDLCSTLQTRHEHVSWSSSDTLRKKMHSRLAADSWNKRR